MERAEGEGLTPAQRAMIENLRAQLARGEVAEETARAIIEALRRPPGEGHDPGGWWAYAPLDEGEGVDIRPLRHTRLAPEGVEYVADVSPAQWVQDSLRDFSTVRALVPEGYPAYARIFHPAYLGGDDPRPVRWSEIASWTGRNVHPLMQFDRIANVEADRQPPWGELPGDSTLPEAECRTLNATLRRFTSTPDRCWFCVWEGNGYIEPRLYERARVKAPGRDYVLFRGSLESIMAFKTAEAIAHWGYSPNLWWPDDRSWFVGTDIYLDYTFLAGSAECVEAVLTHPELEALPSAADAPVYADTVNPPPDLQTRGGR